MNTIPTTSKPVSPSYTVVGGAREDFRRTPRGISIVLLNRGGIVNRTEILEDFEKLDADEIISIESSGDSYAVESLAVRFPRIRFILLHHPANPGECINLGMEESAGGLVAVFWSDMRVPPSEFSGKALERIREGSFLCTVPWFLNNRGELLPTLQVPAFHKKRLKIFPISPSRDEAPSLFPYDYSGIYSKKRYVLLGGYDHQIGNPYWQKLDFGFRAHLWGESIVCSRLFRVFSSESAPVENAGPDDGSRVFFLKNLAVRFTGDRGELPWKRFPAFFLHSGCGLPSALHQYRRARRWVEVNTYRFRMDSQSVTELWEDPEA